MYDALDIHGGSTGIPVWMTEPQWKKLCITDRAKVSLKTLQELCKLLAKQNSCSNGNETFHGGQGNDNKETTDAAATAEVEQTASERRNASRASSPTGGIVTAGTSE